MENQLNMPGIPQFENAGGYCYENGDGRPENESGKRARLYHSCVRSINEICRIATANGATQQSVEDCRSRATIALNSVQMLSTLGPLEEVTKSLLKTSQEFMSEPGLQLTLVGILHYVEA